MTYLASGPFSPRPFAGAARILQPIDGNADRAARPFSAWLPYAQALTWARELAETYGRPYLIERAA